MTKYEEQAYAAIPKIAKHLEKANNLKKAELLLKLKLEGANINLQDIIEFKEMITKQ